MKAPLCPVFGVSANGAYAAHGCRCAVCAGHRSERNREYRKANWPKEREQRRLSRNADVVASREKERGRRAAYLARHPEARQRAAERTARYKAKNPEKVAAYRRQRYAGNAEAEKAQARRWHRAHPDAKRRHNRTWVETHPEAARLPWHRRRAREHNASGVCNAEQLRARVEYFGERCYMCGGAYEAVDHVKPLARGGSNWPANLRPSCRVCNQRKGVRSIEAAMQGDGQKVLQQHEMANYEKFRLKSA